MTNLKNLTLAWACTTTCFAAALETASMISIISSIILPVVFFALGKLVDLALQLYFLRRDRQAADRPSQNREP